jgi:hypothetical protein
MQEGIPVPQIMGGVYNAGLKNVKNNLKKVIQSGLLFFYARIKGRKQKTLFNLKIEKAMKKLLTTIVMLTTTLMVFAQTIEEQAEKAGNEAFAGAMIRNILLIVGGIVIYSVIKSGKTKKEDQQSK